MSHVAEMLASNATLEALVLRKVGDLLLMPRAGVCPTFLAPTRFQCRDYIHTS